MANVPISNFVVPANTVGIGATGYSLTGSASASFVDLAGTWNTSGTPTLIKANVTDTASNANSLLMDLQVGGSSRFQVNKSGFAVFNNNANYAVGVSNNALVLRGNSSFYSFGGTSTGLTVSNLYTLSFTNSNVWDTSDVFVGRRAAANLRLGAADAAAPVAQTLSVQGRTGTNAAATDYPFTIQGAQGTGTGAGGAIRFQVAPAGLDGSGVNGFQTALTINADLSSSFAQNSQGISLSLSGAIILPSNRGISLNGFNSATRINAANFQIQSSGVISFTATDNAGASADTILAREAAGVTAVRGSNTTTGGALSFIEQTAPAAPAANGVRIYAEDNGSGKTRLMALFATGVAQQIAVEP